MKNILSVPLNIAVVDSEALAETARGLFRQYAVFLQERLACGHFDHARFQLEIATLPAEYLERDGDVLLALSGAEACGCVAYRRASASGTCEIKRLFVAPAARGQGVARALVAEALRRARALGFNRVILDTDLEHMPAAEQLYLSFGFEEYGTRQGAIAFYQLTLAATAACGS